MEENEFRDALRSVLTQSPEPPPMESSAAVTAGKRAARRRTVLACAGAVAALAAVTIVPARYLSQGPSGSGDIQVAGPAASALPSGMPTPGPSDGVPAPEDTKPSWPAEASGDATADTGPRYQKGKQLLTDLLKVVPKGYGTPAGKDDQGTEYQTHQAAIENPEWSYLASVVVTKDRAAGQLDVEVHEPENTLPTDPCALAQSFWGQKAGTCEVVQVGGAKVGVARPPAGDTGVDQYAAYRYADGTVVFVAQARKSIFDKPALAELPYTTAQLAALTQNKAFHIVA
ncbi:hypothetical protein [Actinoplanes sp. L3-i22]|uniref:hypothetical protein n=1 Tax=Actinoplanes sp. L3-i22 TaxID=2836373 RepID=UPI001C7835E2|nr:hypothetical protein [Actinoplanes sp. L3-i22]BCY12653.1 hypothetical protein L3i22_077410 [Actinoplanes sp. L3-i22]